MKKTETVDLIKGTFTPQEAREILLHLLDSKINFHNMKSWSFRERFGKPNADSEEKLKHLKESRKTVETLIAKSVTEEKTLTISSIIEINIE